MEKSKSKGLKELFNFAENRGPLIALGCFLSAISAILSIAPFICIWFIVKNIFISLPTLSNSKNIIEYGWWALGFAVLSILLYFIGLMCTHLAAFRVEKNMRKEAIHKIVNLPLGFFSKNTSGKLRKIIDDNASLTHGFLAHQLPDFAGAIIMPIAIIIVLFIFDWKLGLVCLVPLLASIFFLKLMMGGKNASFMKKYMNALEDMNSSAVEYVRGIPVVKVFQQTVYSFKNFHKSIECYRNFASDYAMACRVPMVNFSVTVSLPSLLLIPIGILLILNTGDYKNFLLNLIFYMMFAPLCITMMSKIMHSSENIMIAKEALNRLEQIIETPLLKQSTVSKLPGSNKIEFKNVSFSYPENNEKAVDNVSFTIPDGKTYALVGPSGGGKSTIASLIPRFWDIKQGAIKIGEVNVKDFKEEELMKKIAFVFQNSRLFKSSLKDNIKVAKPNASDKEVLNAIHMAQCDDILEKLPKGIDTVVGEKGAYLSGGEVQRISIARAILKDAPIIVLDEATAFADPENEYQIQKAFKLLTKGKTVLIIAHRLSSIKDVDNIMVVNEGKIIESGNHEQLLKKGEVYCKMWNEYLSSICWKVEKE